MKKIVLKDGTQFPIESVIDYGSGMIEIEFSPTVKIEDIASIYSPSRSTFNEDRISEFSLVEMYEQIEGEALTEEKTLGVHMGYTEPKDITYFNDIVKIKVQQEPAVNVEVRELKKLVLEQSQIINIMLTSTMPAEPVIPAIEK